MAKVNEFDTPIKGTESTDGEVTVKTEMPDVFDVTKSLDITEEVKECGKKVWTCSCGYSTAKKYHFERHVLTHQKREKFQCDVCLRFYSRKDHLQLGCLFMVKCLLLSFSF